MYLSYDLAKAIQRERLSRSMAEYERKQGTRLPSKPTARGSEGAEIIELVFSSHCDTDRIGA